MVNQLMVDPENNFTQGVGQVTFAADGGTLFRFSLEMLAFISAPIKDMYCTANRGVAGDIIPMEGITPDALRLIFTLITDRNSEHEQSKDIRWPEDATIASLCTAIDKLEINCIYPALMSRINFSCPWKRPLPVQWFVLATVAGKDTGDALRSMRNYGLDDTNSPQKLLDSRSDWMVEKMSGLDVLSDWEDVFWDSHHDWQRTLRYFKFSLETDFQLDHHPEECGDLSCTGCNRYHEDPDQFATSEARANGVTEKVWEYLKKDDPWVKETIAAWVESLNLSIGLTNHLKERLFSLTTHMNHI